MAKSTDPRADVRERYAEAARHATEGSFERAKATEASCVGPGAVSFGDVHYDADEATGATEAALSASLGCGVPTAVADLHEGETVLDLGSGAGADVLISARRVGESGNAIGLDMTDEMLELARQNAIEAGVEKVELIKGYVEQIPLPDAAVDVVISNCVVSLSADKRKVIREVARVLRDGGRLALTDVLLDDDLGSDELAELAETSPCLAGALSASNFRLVLEEAGFEGIEIRESQRIHERAGSFVVRGRKPSHEQRTDPAKPQVHT